VRQDVAGAVVDDFERADHADDLTLAAGGVDEGHPVEREGRIVVADEHTLGEPGPEEIGGLLVAAVAVAFAWHVDPDDVVVVPCGERVDVGIRQYIVGRSRHLIEQVGGISQCWERFESRHEAQGGRPVDLVQTCFVEPCRQIADPASIEFVLCDLDGVTHTVERVTSTERVAAISTMVWSDDVLIADGHHRYGVARRYRDEIRAETGDRSTPAELTLAFVSELVADQLSVEAIHRVYRGIDLADLIAALEVGFEMTPAGPVDPTTLGEMQERGALCLAEPNGDGHWLTPRADVFDEIRSLDGLWLEHLLDETTADVTYQHGVDELSTLMTADDSVTAAVLIRPVGVDEIERTAREGLLMPPKSTFFTPKLLTGLVLRPLY